MLTTKILILYIEKILILKFKYIMKIRGSMNENAKETNVQYTKVQNHKLITTKKTGESGVLTDQEIVIYAFIGMTSYNFRTKRTIYKGPLNRLAVALSISKAKVKESIEGLIKKGMLKKVYTGYEIIGTRLKGDYIMVKKTFLITKILTTSQKAFLLRVDALRREGIIKEDRISNNQLGPLLNVSKEAVRKTLNTILLKQKEDTLKWIMLEDGEVLVDYSLLDFAVASDLSEEVVDYRVKEASKPKVYVPEKKNVPMTQKKILKVNERRAVALARMEQLLNEKIVTEKKYKTLVKYMNDGRMSLLENTLDKIEEKYKD